MEGETPKSQENAQCGAELESGEELLPTIAKFSENKAKVSDAGRVYKKTDKRPKLVDP